MARRPCLRVRAGGVLQCDVEMGPGALRCDVEEVGVCGGAVTRCLLPALRIDALPKALVHVRCVVLRSDGAALSATVSAASVALADAGVPLRDLVGAAEVVVSSLKGADGGCQILVDPTRGEEAAASSSLAVTASSTVITACSHAGAAPGGTAADALAAAVAAAGDARAELKAALLAAAAPGRRGQKRPRDG